MPREVVASADQHFSYLTGRENTCLAPCVRVAGCSARRKKVLFCNSLLQKNPLSASSRTTENCSSDRAAKRIRQLRSSGAARVRRHHLLGGRGRATMKPTDPRRADRRPSQGTKPEQRCPLLVPISVKPSVNLALQGKTLPCCRWKGSVVLSKVSSRM